MLNFIDKNKRYVLATYLLTCRIMLPAFGIEISPDLATSIDGTIGMLIGSALQKSQPK